MTVCVMCGAKKVKRRMVSERRRDGTRVSVSAYVCSACGERVFDHAVVAMLDN